MIAAHTGEIGDCLETGMTLRFRGVRGSLPTPVRENMCYGGNTSCIEVRSGNQLLILDAGSGIRPLGEDLIRASDGNPIEGMLFLSHTHWDHIQGLPFFAPAYSPRNRFRIFCTHGRGSEIQRALSNQMSPPHFPVGLQQMRGLGSVEELACGATTVGNFLVRTTQLNHPGGCAAVRIEVSGASLGYLPDHEPYRTENSEMHQTATAHSELVKFVRDLDVLVLDTQYTEEEYTQRIGWGHGCLPDSVSLAIEAGVARLILFHHDPSHDDRQINKMVECAQGLAVSSGLTIDAARENETLSITPTHQPSGSRNPSPGVLAVGELVK